MVIGDGGISRARHVAKKSWTVDKLYIIQIPLQESATTLRSKDKKLI
jgi:hypothetical protein